MWGPRSARLSYALLFLMCAGSASSCQETIFDPTLFSRPPSARNEGSSKHNSFEEREEAEEPREDEIRTDRDAFTPATRTVGRGLGILESSYSFIDNRGGTGKHSLPELLIRYGATDRLELRFGWNYEVGGGANVATGQSVGESDPAKAGISRESRFLYGVKAQITERSQFLPESCLIVHGYTTLGETQTSTFSAGYVFGWELPAKWRWDTAVRFATVQEANEHFREWAPSTVLRVPLSERWQVHAEYFGLISDGREQNFSRHFFSPGAHYLITSNFEVGVRVGWGLNDQSARFFSNVGFGWRF